MRLFFSLLVIVAGAGLVASSRSTAPAQRTGGTLRLSSILDVDSVDPAIAYGPRSWMIEYATCAELYNYPDKPAPQGAIAVPEVAKSFPSVSKDGKTQTIELKRTWTSSTGASSFRTRRIGKSPPSTESTGRTGSSSSTRRSRRGTSPSTTIGQHSRVLARFRS
jgi:ABC-type oligopeptide transport system substrate-binding subunit